MRKIVLALFLILPSSAFANSVFVSMSPVTFFGGTHNICTGQPGCIFETFSASFLMDADTGILDPASMSISASGAIGDFSGATFFSVGHIGDTYWYNAAGDFIQLWPSEHCIVGRCFIDLRIPGIWTTDVFVCSPALFGSCGYLEHSNVTVTAVPEIPAAGLMLIVLTAIILGMIFSNKMPSLHALEKRSFHELLPPIRTLQCLAQQVIRHRTRSVLL